MTNTGDDFVFSLKPHGGYDAPLLVIKAATPAEMAGKLAALAQANLWANVADADTELKAAWNLAKEFEVTPVAETPPPAQNYQQGQQNQYNGNSNGYQQNQNQNQNNYQQNQGQQNYQGQNQQNQQNTAPSGRQPTPPGMVAPNCPHGTKTYVLGEYGPFWGCPGRRNDPGRCKPEKIKT